ncbi:carbonic anhydrase [Podospora conica]|nr:carbonic anhydrase [Schizothecium conicum]
MATTIADLLKRNVATSAKHIPLPHHTVLSPIPKTMIVTCMDPRCIPEKFFDIKETEVLVARNTGGIVRNALNDIHVADALFDLDELAIIHHTDCGTLSWTEETIRSKVRAYAPEEHWAEIDRTVYGAIANLEDGVRADVEWVRAHPLITEKLKKGTQGFVFDIESGEVRKVDV